MLQSFFIHFFTRYAQRLAVVVFILIVVGVVLRPIESSSWRVVKAGQPEMNLNELEGALGQGVVIGVLGGFRAVLADFLWIRLNTIWERKDRVKMGAMVQLVTTLDPRPDFFWINGARMTAYDVPNWRIREEGGYDAVPEARQREIDEEQSAQAFELLHTARKFHPDSPKFALEIAQIYLNRLKDDANAAEWFLKASKMDGAPHFASRIYAELLRRQGKDEEAYDYLKSLHDQLPDNDPYAQKNVILQRIRELEQTLKVPVWKRFMPAEAASVFEPSETPKSFFDPTAPVPHQHDHGDHDHDHAH